MPRRFTVKTISGCTKLKIKLSVRNVSLAAFAAVLLVATVLFGAAGFRTITAIALFFFLPFYLIFRQLKLENDEKIFFSFFAGLGIFPLLVFAVGRMIPSFRAAVVVVLVLLFVLYYFMRNRSLRKENPN
jgi:predicted neutral ceramidase superfamily lipid hydrolase